MSIEEKYPNISEKALIRLLRFSTFYVSKIEFSTLSQH